MFGGCAYNDCEAGNLTGKNTEDFIVNADSFFGSIQFVDKNDLFVY